MFSIDKLTVSVRDFHSGGRKVLLDDFTLSLPKAHFAAIVGPSGCGKSSFVRTLMGLYKAESGRILVDGHDLLENLSFVLPEIGYVPQFSIAHEDLTALEALEYAADLRLPPGLGREGRERRILDAVELVEMTAFVHVKVSFLSGGQKRRLALAMELLRDPAILILDEVTSGLDPRSEEKFMELFQRLAHQYGKTVVCITHNVEHLALCDSILVLHEGRLLFHGTLEGTLEHFQISEPGRLYGKLHEHRDAPTHYAPGLDDEGGAGASGRMEFSRLPGLLAQWFHLTTRQFKLFFRNPTQVMLQAVLMFGFPFLVVIFATDGLPQVHSMSMELSTDIVSQYRQEAESIGRNIEVATLASGLIMFQVILLTLMGSNNGAREIVKERVIFEKEKLAGLSPMAYLLSKVFFVTVLSLLQSGIMMALVKHFCRFPGDWRLQFLILFLATLAMSMTCLMFSSMAKTTEQSSLVSIYLVGLQLPLSGAVLALPKWILWVTQPLIDAYWAWSGYIRTMTDSRVYDVVVQHTQTSLASPPAAVAMLSAHFLFCFLLSAWFVKKRSLVL